MKCPYCCYLQSRVVDSRQSEDGSTIRRRRECEGCGRRFTTYERIDMVPLIVVKKDQTRETFDVNKLRSGIIKACEKRPVPLSKIDELAGEIERKLTAQPESEVTSQAIGASRRSTRSLMCASLPCTGSFATFRLFATS